MVLQRGWLKMVPLFPSIHLARIHLDLVGQSNMDSAEPKLLYHFGIVQFYGFLLNQSKAIPI